MGYSPTMWGREAWHFIHYVCLNYPDKPTDQQKETYKQFFLNIAEVLPCPFCGLHFLENMKEYPIRLDSKKDLFEWSVDMHNEVNKSNGKQTLTYEEALREINKNSARGVHPTYAMNFEKIKKLDFKFKKIKNGINKK